jgi:hypothetical protein
MIACLLYEGLIVCSGKDIVLLQVAKAMPRVVENVHDRLPADSALAVALARLWTKGDKPFFQIITENKDTPKQVCS